MNNVILSLRYPQFAAALQRRGYHVIPSEYIERLIPYERDHADMQCLIIDDTAFVLSCCDRLIKELRERYRVVVCGEDIAGKYPENVRLNATVVGKTLIGRIRSLDENVKYYCRTHGYEIINVNQGYAGCACAVVNDRALITADKGIYNSLKETNIEVLLIEQGRVMLDGAEYGFIGGACGTHTVGDEHIICFCGDIQSHPDHDRIMEFCERQQTKIICLDKGELIDIGGMIFC